MSPAVECHALQEIAFTPGGKAANPYDPDDISVMAEFRAPSGKRYRLPAFFYEEYDPIHNTRGEDGGWRVRFAPRELGTYAVALTVSRRGGPARELAYGVFKSAPSRRTGFVTVRNGRFALTTGEEFLALGGNLCWGDVGRTETYLADMAALAETGAGVIRVWLAPWWLPVEHEHGRYDQAACARLDAIVQQAEKLGLKIILCLEQHGNFQPAGAEIGRWPEHPYNAARGGPCPTVRRFFNGTGARRLFRNRLRYLVARYAYSTAVMAWELFNEVELVAFDNDDFEKNLASIAAWHIHMSACLRRTDPFNHLIATSAHLPLQERLVRRGAVDFIQVHVYERGDLAERIRERLAEADYGWRVPLVVAEFGHPPPDADPRYVTRGVFASMLAGRGGGALPWLQDEKRTKERLPSYRRLAAAARFFKRVHWRNRNFAPVALRVRAPGVDAVDALPKLLALQSGDEVLLFVYPATVAVMGEGRGAVRLPVSVRIPGLRPGVYSTEFWNAEAGKIIWRVLAATTGETLNVAFPLLENDAAVRIVWVRDAPAVSLDRMQPPLDSPGGRGR